MTREATKTQEGVTLDYTASGSDISAGEVVVIGDVIGVAVADIDDGDEGALFVEGVFQITAEAGTAWSVGDQLYWDDANSEFTKTASTHNKAGIAAASKGSAATTGYVKLNVNG